VLSFTEALHDGYGQSFRVDRLLHYEKTEHQELVIFDNASFGRVLALDGVVQLTERDHHIYHEMIAHVPILGHGSVRDVLIIGGGDGGTLHEVLRHADLRAVMVEIDPQVIALSRRYLPMVGQGAFDDPRAEIVIGDGLVYVAESERRFDVIIVDSTDPVGPASALFSPEFYADCRRCLNPGGILVTQNGVPFFQAEQLRASMTSLRNLFREATCYLAAVPTYTGGPIALGWASDVAAHRGERGAVEARYRTSGLTTRYYAPDVHEGAFTLPPEVRGVVEG
jgi:spermidine synthase